ncbi:uncharacterized protein LOC120682390 isoform X1 [Panicum virgatum]|uniref:uncharacterized protein LOC120682390 isoform X1 n=2 Tax=Panicum virgatum TaxID=38727 RepID=UPI0019D50F93|nr:uncharacterized protein LOC120682390 isoform X1 [Panicum virgatum]
MLVVVPGPLALLLVFIPGHPALSVHPICRSARRSGHDHYRHHVRAGLLKAGQLHSLVQSNRYIIRAQIKYIVPNQSWWYLACEKCNRTLQPHGEKYKCVGPTCSGTGGPRYSLPIIATDLVAPREQQNERTIQLVFFGSIAQEIIDTPVGTLIAANEGVGIFLPTKITAIYGKQYELRVSISSMSLQHINITYQVDAIIGMGSIPASTPPHLHLALEGQPSHQSATESQQLHSTDKSTLITGTAPNGSGSTPPECNKDISSALPHIDISGTENTKFEIHARTKAPESSESNLLSTPASVEDLEKAQVYLITSYLLYCIENQIPFDYVIQQDYTCLSPCILLTQRQKRTNVRLMRHLIAMVKMIQVIFR